MSALWIANVHVTDDEAYVQLEGRDRPRNVVARFPSVEAAEACYNSPEYQEALSHARDASERDLVIVEEL